MRWGDLMISAEGHKRSLMLTAVSGEFSQPKIQPRGFVALVCGKGGSGINGAGGAWGRRFKGACSAVRQ